MLRPKGGAVADTTPPLLAPFLSQSLYGSLTLSQGVMLYTFLRINAP